MKQLWSFAWKNVVLYRRRHFFSGVGLSVGFCGVILLGGYMLRMEDYLAAHTIFLRDVGHFSIIKKNSLKFYFQNPERYSLSAAEQEKIKSILNTQLQPNDKLISVLSGAGMITNGCISLPVIYTGINSEDNNWLYSHEKVREQIPELARFEKGSGYWNAAADLSPINVSPVLFSRLKKNSIYNGGQLPSSLITNCSSVEEQAKNSNDPSMQIYSPAFGGGLGISDAVLVGLKSTGFTFSDETSVMMPLKVAQTLLRTDNLSRIAVVVANTSGLGRLENQIQAKIREAGLEDIEVRHYKDEEISPIYVGAMNFVYVMLGFFAVLVCGIVILSVTNSFQIAFLERRHEFATLRSLGFRSGILRTILVFEYIQMATLSFISGGLLAFVLKTINNSLNLRFEIPGFANDLQFRLEPTPVLTWMTAVLMMLIVVVSAYALASRQMKLKVVELMEAVL